MQFSISHRLKPLRKPMKINFASFCACKNDGRIWCHNSVPCVRVTILSQKRPPLATMAKWAIDGFFLSLWRHPIKARSAFVGRIHRWFSLTKSEKLGALMILWCTPKGTVEQTVNSSVISYTMMVMWRHCNLAHFCVQGTKQRVRDKIMYEVPWITILCR